MTIAMRIENCRSSAEPRPFERKVRALALGLSSVLVLLCLCAPSAWAAAARTADFYQGAAVLDSRTDAGRDAATRAALAQVLVRMTGDVSISLNEAVQAVLLNAPRYMRGYRIDQPAALTTDEGVEMPAAAPRLLVDFDAAALNQALKGAGLPIWAEQRAISAVWVLAPNERGPRQIWDSSAIAANLPALAEASQRRGVPVAHAAMDAQEQELVGPLDIISRDYARLAMASERYGARHVLTLTLEPKGELWYANWSALAASEPAVNWQSYGNDPNAAVAAGFDQYADQMARRYVVKVTAGWVQTTRLRVVGLKRLADYATVLNNLEKLSLVQSVQPREVLNGDVVFLVTFEGDTSDLSRSIALGGILQESVAPTPASSWSGTLNAPTSGVAGEQGATPAGATPNDPATGASPSGLSFYAVAQQPELRYQLRR